MFIYPMMMYPKLPVDYDVPPTIYALLNSIVNFGKEEKTKISELAKKGRTTIFDFEYPLTTGITKEDFECMILNHYMMRRIGYETLTAFKLALNVKLNEIMPMYNKLFNAIDGWEIFIDGEVTTREQISSTSANNHVENITDSDDTSDRRYSDTPQNELQDVRDGKYISDYNYDHNTGNITSSTTGNSNDTGNINETITRTPADKMTNYVEFIKEKQNIYTMIFKDLDVLFYQII